MATDTTFLKLNLQNIVQNSQRFAGRYQIDGAHVSELRKDFWADNTVYQIYSPKSDSRKFEEHCFSKLAAIAPADIFMSPFTSVKTYYVPMLLAEGKFICLYDNDDTLSYSLMDNGIMPASQVEQALGKAAPFAPGTYPDFSKVEFLSMMLTLKGASYIARVNDVRYNFSHDSGHAVYFVPIHSMSFRYNGKEYTLMSLADEKFTGFASNIPLPEDPILAQKEAICKMPWITIVLMSVFTLGISSSTIALVLFVLKNLKIDIFFRLILLALPIYIIYAVSLATINVIGKILGQAALELDIYIAEKAQKKAIEKNFENKRHDLIRRPGGKCVAFPDTSKLAKFTHSMLRSKFDDLMQFLNNFAEKTLTR